MELTKAFSETRALAKGRVGLVPTMGAFHEGHTSLMKAIRERCDTLVVSVFVNPTQFEKEDDLESYPRDLASDTVVAEELSVDVLFAPEVDEVYPAGSATVVEVPGISQWMEGKHRPGHFSGVATVVTKLFAGIRPDVAIFGRKDAQQLAVIRGLSRDLRFPVEVIDGPTVRDWDGLALSSRNVRLSSSERETALGLSRGLFRAADQIDAGEFEGDILTATVRDACRDLAVEYVTLAALGTMVPIKELKLPAVLAMAGRVGPVRLIDNITIDFNGSEAEPDRGVILDEPSRLGTLR